MNLGEGSEEKCDEIEIVATDGVHEISALLEGMLLYVIACNLSYRLPKKGPKTQS